MSNTLLADDRLFFASAPAVRADALVRQYGNEIVAWSPDSPYPFYFEPVGALVVQLLDGTATVGELAKDVHDVVGVPTGVARDQIRRVVARLDEAMLLTTSHQPGRAEDDVDDLGIFLGPPNP